MPRVPSSSHTPSPHRYLDLSVGSHPTTPFVAAHTSFSSAHAASTTQRTNLYVIDGDGEQHQLEDRAQFALTPLLFVIALVPEVPEVRGGVRRLTSKKQREN